MEPGTHETGCPAPPYWAAWCRPGAPGRRARCRDRSAGPRRRRRGSASPRLPDRAPAPALSPGADRRTRPGRGARVTRPAASAKAILLAATLQGAALPLGAQTGDIARLFPARPTGYVTDQTGTLDPAVVQRITALCERLRAATRG